MLIGDAGVIAESVRNDLETARPASEPVQFTGEGDTLTSTFSLNAGLLVAEMEHAGEGFFGPVIQDNEGNDKVFLAITSDDYQGEVIDSVAEAGDYMVEVDARGTWSITIKQPRFDQHRQLPTGYQGFGDTVLEPFETQGRLVRFDYAYDGDSNLP